MVKSRASKTTSKAALPKIEPSTLISPEFEGTDPDSLIFPEWSDLELNSETWEHPKVLPLREEVMETLDENNSFAPIQQKIILPPPPLPYRDSHGFTLPSSLNVYKWKRPEALFPGKKVVIYKESPRGLYSNFMNGNIHVFISQFMRSFVATIGILEYLGQTALWEMEGVTASYTPNTLEEPWRAWHHIYSGCKAGKGQKHKPVVNEIGKYFLRIYWMGAWRRIIVDDFIPVDSDNRILLPQLSNPVANISSQSQSSKKSFKKGSRKSVSDRQDEEIIELWPFLLCKGLLKIGNLTWSNHRETYDMNILHNLTGWLCQKLNTLNLDSSEIWDICATYAPHYTWPEDKDSDKTGAYSEKSNKSKKTKGDKSDKDKPSSKPAVDNDPTPFCIVAKVADTRSLSDDAEYEETLMQFAPCWSHLFLINQIRNVPLEKPEYKPKLELWKRFRWLDWARARGIYSEEESSLKFLQIVDFFKDLEVEASISSYTFNAPATVNYGEEEGGNEEDLYYDNVTREAYFSNESKENYLQTSLFEVSNVSQSTQPVTSNLDRAETPLLTYDIPDDPTIWVEFNDFGRFIDTLYIYFKPKLMQSYVTITDMQAKNPPQILTKDAKSAKDSNPKIIKRILWPYQLKESINQPIYLFFDTLEPKILVVSLCHAGNRAILEQKCLVVHCDLTSLWQKKFNFRSRCNMRFQANLVLDNYNWQTEAFTDFVLGMNTTCNKCAIMTLPAGRKVMRLWLTSKSSYNVTILSDANIEVGPAEYILEVMQSESTRLLHFCLQFGTKFGNLVQNFGSSSHLNALIAFFNSCTPTGATAKESAILRDRLIEMFAVLLRDKYEECGEALFCLRVLFLVPTLGKKQCPPIRRTSTKKYVLPPIRVQAPPEWDDNECLSTESTQSIKIDDINIEKTREHAACIIQSFFKMIYVKKLREYHNESHPLFSKVFEILKKIYKDLFNVENRINLFPGIFREILIKPEPYDDLYLLLPKYSWQNDIKSVVNNQLLQGLFPVPTGTLTNQWILLCRYIFYVDSPHEEMIKAILFTNLSLYALRVINNDNLKETFRQASLVCVDKYSCNAKGYTILGYGWIPEQLPESIKYKLDLITVKRSARYALNIVDSEVAKPVLCGIFHSNKKGLIGRCAVGIENDLSLSVRFKCSYNQVLVKLTCHDKHGELVQEMTGKGNIILPVLNLKYTKEEPNSTSKIEQFRSSKRSSTSIASKSTSQIRRKSGSAIERISRTESIKSTGSLLSKSKISCKNDTKCSYTLEAHVLRDSWPLTRDEWKVSDKLIKRNYIKSISTSKTLLKKLSGISNSKDYDLLPDPKWSLQLMYNCDNSVQLNFDQSRLQEIRKLKLKWFEESSERYDKAKKLRADFLEEMRRLEKLEASSSNVPELSNYLSLEEAISGTYSNFESQLDDDALSERSRTYVHPDSSSKSPLDFTLYAYPSTTVVSDTMALAEDATSYPSQKTLPLGYKCFELLDNTYEGVLKKPVDFERDSIKTDKAIEEFDIYHKNYVENMEEYRKKSLIKSQKLQNWFDGIQSESKSLLQHAYKLRETFIGLLAPENAISGTRDKKIMPGSPASMATKKSKSKK